MASRRPEVFAPAVRERAVRRVSEHQAEYDEYETQWGAIRWVAETIGCSAEAIRGPG